MRERLRRGMELRIGSGVREIERRKGCEKDRGIEGRDTMKEM